MRRIWQSHAGADLHRYELTALERWLRRQDGWHRMRSLALLAALALFGASCGGAESAAPATVTVQETVQETITEPSAATVEATAPPVEGGSIEVPNVVGLDHQLAQDSMQAAGLYSLDEEDATGQGRLLLFDRNWTVVSQDPAAGTMVTEGQTILLRSKKDGE